MSDYSYLKKCVVPVQFVSAISGIDAMNVRIRDMMEERIQQAANMKRAVSVSNRKTAHMTGIKQEGFYGFCSVLDKTAEGTGVGELSVSYLQDLHRMMLPGEEGGRFRMETGPLGENELLKDTCDHLESMCQSYEMVRRSGNVHPLLLIGAVLADFMRIAPFSVGNMQMADLLARRLLIENGYEAVRYRPCRMRYDMKSLEEAVGRIAKDWEMDGKSSLPFTQYLLEQLKESYLDFEEKLNAVKTEKMTKNDRIEKVILERMAPISKSEICECLPDVSETTVEAKLAMLCREQKIKRLGSKKNSTYVKW